MMERMSQAADSARLQMRVGFEPTAPSNPYWVSDGAACFVDPDGYWLIASPAAWLGDDGAVHDE